GCFFEMGPSSNLVLPHRLIRVGAPVSENRIGFSLAGPTCDSYDMMQGPFMLPEDAREGDWLEIGQIGAYSTSSQTRFNGFGQISVVTVRDAYVNPAA